MLMVEQGNGSSEEAGPLQEAFKRLAFPDENVRPTTSNMSPTAEIAGHMKQVAAKVLAIQTLNPIQTTTSD